MTVLLLHLAAPLQSWGTGSRFVRRNTDRWPSKSGVIGLLAAAKGLRRTDRLEDLLSLRIGVRVEQPGRLERDFQTARPRDGSPPLPLSYRFYLADAAFLVAIDGEQQLLTGLRDALRRPVYPLFLGRRSCPPAMPLVRGMRDGDMRQVLADEPWAASRWAQRAHRAPDAQLDTVMDCEPGTGGSDVVRDEPISFDPRHRDYGWRTVLHGQVTVPNPEHRGALAGPPTRDTHRPMDLLGGAMYLTRFEINTARRGARELLSSPQKVHGAVMAAFPPGQREPCPEGRVLWRLDQHEREAALYLVSPYRPDLTHLVESAGWPATQGWDTRSYAPLLDRLTNGERWHFRLTANPVHNIRTAPEQSKTKRGGHVTVTQQTDWLLRQSERCGFSVPESGPDKEPDVAVRRRRVERFQRQGRTVTISTAVFEGTLEVTDPVALRHRLTHGIGHAKGYGCGLLTLAR